MDAFRNELTGIDERIARLEDERAEIDREATELRGRIAQLHTRKLAKPNHGGRVVGFLACGTFGFFAYHAFLASAPPAYAPATIELAPHVETFRRDDGTHDDFRIERPYDWKASYGLARTDRELPSVPPGPYKVDGEELAITMEASTYAGTVLFAAGERGTILQSTSDGIDWHREGIWAPTVDDRIVDGLHGITVGPSGELVAVGDLGLIVHRLPSTTYEHPSTWWQSNALTERSLRAVISLGSDKAMYALGDRGTLLRRDGPEPKSPWKMIATPTQDDLVAGIATHASDMIILGTRQGRIITYRPKDDLWSVDSATLTGEPVRGFKHLNDAILLVTTGDHTFTSELRR